MLCKQLSGAVLFLVVLVWDILINGNDARHLTDTSVCKDVYIWIADGSVDCKYLATPSINGVHKRPKYYCTKYSQTDCCETCTRLGFTKGDKNATTPSVTTTTLSPTTTISRSTTVPTTESPRCRDFGVWIASGLVSCKYLQTESFWGLHTRSEYYCKRYSFTWCCHTCANINSLKSIVQVNNL